jgi:hypothetical protein
VTNDTLLSGQRVSVLCVVRTCVCLASSSDRECLGLFFSLSQCVCVCGNTASGVRVTGRRGDGGNFRMLVFTGRELPSSLIS